MTKLITNQDFQLAVSANSTSGSFTAKAPVATAPSGTGVHALDVPEVPQYVVLAPFGTNANNGAFNMRLWGWIKVDTSDLWIPYKLLELAVTLGNIDASEIGTDHFMADTISITNGDSDAPLINPADDTGATILVHHRGAQYMEFDFDLTTAAAANCYWSLMG